MIQISMLPWIKKCLLCTLNTHGILFPNPCIPILWYVIGFILTNLIETDTWSIIKVALLLKLFLSNPVLILVTRLVLLSSQPPFVLFLASMFLKTSLYINVMSKMPSFMVILLRLSIYVNLPARSALSSLIMFFVFTKPSMASSRLLTPSTSVFLFFYHSLGYMVVNMIAFSLRR